MIVINLIFSIGIIAITIFLTIIITLANAKNIGAMTERSSAAAIEIATADNALANGIDLAITNLATAISLAMTDLAVTNALAGAAA